MPSESLVENKTTFLYRFLVSPQLRVARHVVLVLALGVICFNQLFMFYLDFLEELGNSIYWLTLFEILMYVAVVYFNLFYLLPKYLLAGRYKSYIVSLSLTMLLLVGVQIVQEYMISRLWPQTFTRDSFFTMAVVMDYLSSFMLTMFCMLGGTMTVLLKLWMVNSQRVAQLERAHVMSEVEQLKEQVSPELLFNILHRAGQLALTEPGKASKILMKLSKLLRYQLYDCNREKVLLGSEMTFLDNYLTLEQLYSARFRYTLSPVGEVGHTLVPPLLFIPFVQHAVKRIYEQPEDVAVASVELRMEVEEEDVTFTCSCPGIDLSVDNGLERIRQRLDLQYGERYRLLFPGGSIRLELKGGGL
ncbi:sensor histidine kinase [Bacteroides sp.]